MIKDRGMKKWQGMMLPEHVRFLGEHRRKLTLHEQPFLDEQQYERMQEILVKLLNCSAEAEYKVWDNGEYKRWRGTITKIDVYARKLHYKNAYGYNEEPLNIDNIVDISPL